VAAALAGDLRGPRKIYRPFVPALSAMDALARRLRARRFERGALELDLPEAKVVLDDDDPRRIRDVLQARRDPGERGAYAMIEEFMLAANEAVGESFAKRGEATQWRINDVPDAAKLELFAAMAKSYGLPFDPEDARTPKGLAAVLARLKGHAAEKPLGYQLLRSLKQAIYDVVNVGHFGLASAAYVHFTSPIRRYPDLVVHRLLKRRLATLGKPAGGFPPLHLPPAPPDAAALGRMARESSFSERKAMEVEREVLDLHRAFFMRDRIGDVLEGTISGVTSFGIFVMIKEPFV
jgi:ribonuclease R